MIQILKDLIPQSIDSTALPTTTKTFPPSQDDTNISPLQLGYVHISLREGLSSRLHGGKPFTNTFLFLLLVGRSRHHSGLWLLWGRVHRCVSTAGTGRAVALVLLALLTLLLVADLCLPRA